MGTANGNTLRQPTGDDESFASTFDAETTIVAALSEISTLGDLLSARNRGANLGDETLERLGMMLLAKSKAANDAWVWLAEHRDNDSGAA